LFAACLAVVSTKPVARRCSPKKTVSIHASSWRSRHCGVAHASFDHPCWCGPHNTHVHIYAGRQDEIRN
jgi:hypothetical protein